MPTAVEKVAALSHFLVVEVTDRSVRIEARTRTDFIFDSVTITAR